MRSGSEGSRSVARDSEAPRGTTDAKDDPEAAGLAAWSLVHGFAMLWLNEAIDTDADAVATMQRMAQMLFTK